MIPPEILKLALLTTLGHLPVDKDGFTLHESQKYTFSEIRRKIFDGIFGEKCLKETLII